MKRRSFNPSCMTCGQQIEAPLNTGGRPRRVSDLMFASAVKV
jgi:hypothetical protein